jgi:hypothetical protein
MEWSLPDWWLKERNMINPDLEQVLKMHQANGYTNPLTPFDIKRVLASGYTDDFTCFVWIVSLDSQSPFYSRMHHDYNALIVGEQDGDGWHHSTTKTSIRLATNKHEALRMYLGSITPPPYDRRLNEIALYSKLREQLNTRKGKR